MESTTEITKIQDELLEKKVTEGQTKKTNFSIDSLLQRKLGSLPTENNSTPRKLKSPRCEIRGDCDPPTVFNIQPIGLDSFMRPPFPPFFNGPLMPFPFGQPHHPVDLFFSRFPAPFRSRPPTTVISDDAEVKEDRRGQWDSKPPYNHIPSFNNSLGLEGISRTTGGTTKTPPVKKYKCDICGKAFSRSNTLVTHKVSLL